MRNIGSIIFLSVILLTSTITIVIPPQEASAQSIANSTSTYAMDGSAFTNMTGTFWKDSRYWIFNANNSTYSEKPFPYLGDTQPQHPLQWDATTETFVHQPYVAPPPTVTPATPNATPSTPPPVQQPTYQPPNYQPPTQDVIVIEPARELINQETEWYRVTETLNSDLEIIGTHEAFDFRHILVNGVAKPHYLEETPDKVIYRSNAIGGLIFDKNTCSYSIYENGWGSEPIIPSVSIVGRQADINTDNWSAMQVNNNSCDVTVQDFGDNVYIASLKADTITDQRLEDPLLSNSTMVDYERVLYGVEHELRLDPLKGIKETFKVFTDDDNVKLAVTQTAHTGDILNIGGVDYNIADLDGFFMDRNVIEQNQAQIFEITENLNYDFDKGFGSLWGIGFEQTSTTNKINLDYANMPEVAQKYLEIDPTWSGGSMSGVVDGSNYVFTIPEVYSNEVAVTGGTIEGSTMTQAEINSINTALWDGSTTWSKSHGKTFDLIVTNGGTIEYLIVAGGAAGGGGYGGGGGAGGLLQGTTTVSTQTYPVVIGEGGKRQLFGSSPSNYGGYQYHDGMSGENGDNTTFAGLTAIGGGGGSNYYSMPGDGGSGGGASIYASGSSTVHGFPNSPGSGTAGQGNDGSKGTPDGGYNWARGGAGGGAGAGPNSNDSICSQHGNTNNCVGGDGVTSVSYTHLPLPTSDLV